MRQGKWVRTFVVITTRADELVADIHDRMPVIRAPSDYTRWLGEEADPRDLLRPSQAELMRMRPMSTRDNNPENDDRRSSSRSNWQLTLGSDSRGRSRCSWAPRHRPDEDYASSDPLHPIERAKCVRNGQGFQNDGRKHRIPTLTARATGLRILTASPCGSVHRIGYRS